MRNVEDHGYSLTILISTGEIRLHIILRNQAYCSEWLEATRKEVECVFGTLKGMFRFLEAENRLHGVEVADNIWLTCCALHKYLFEIDDSSIEWQGQMQLFDNEKSC